MTFSISTWVVVFETCVTGFVSCLTFLDLLLFVVLAGTQQSKDDAGLRVEADGWHHHPAWSLHYMGPWEKIQKARSHNRNLVFNCHCVTVISSSFYLSNLFFSCIIEYFKKTPVRIFAVLQCCYSLLILSTSWVPQRTILGPLLLNLTVCYLLVVSSRDMAYLSTLMTHSFIGLSLLMTQG